MVNQVDFVATFAKVTDYDLSNEEAIDSYNLLPISKEEKYTSPLRVATVQNTNKGKYALREGDWALINTHSGAASESKGYLRHVGLKAYLKKTPRLLFYLKDDPRQPNNLYAQHPETVTAMRELLHSYVKGKCCAPQRN